MDVTLERSKELMEKITIGSKVFFDDEWIEVVNITPCEHQHDDDEYKNDICYYCIGQITLKCEIKRLEEPACFSCNNELMFDDVMNIDIEFISKEDMEI